MIYYICFRNFDDNTLRNANKYGIADFIFFDPKTLVNI